MKRKHTHRGAGLVEMLVATLVALILGAGLLGLLRANVIGVSVTTGQVAADYRARRPLDLLTDAMRNAVSYTSSGTKKVVSAATTDSVTVYTDTAGTTAKYWRDGTTTPPTLKRTVGTTTTILVRGVQSLKLTY